MTQETLTALKQFFAGIWYIFTQVTIPGTEELTAAHVLVGFLGAAVFIGFLKKTLDSGAISAGDLGRLGRDSVNMSRDLDARINTTATRFGNDSSNDVKV